MRKITSLIFASLLLMVSVGAAFAAVSDGVGPWADNVVATNQGTRQDGSAVLAIRSDPTSAVGVAENTTTDGTFYSLGFGGDITLGFDNGISSGVIVVEATNNPYPDETAKVEVSPDNTTWTVAGNVAEDGTVTVPQRVGCVNYVRVTDTSDKTQYESTADGYDVDGVEAQGTLCTTSGKMTGGGSVFTASGMRVTHGFVFNCSVADGPNNLQINWGKGNKFHLEDLTFAYCSDEAGYDEGQPDASFDTYQGEGIGRYNGTAGYTVSWVFTDKGEPGKMDTARITIKDPSNNVVLAVDGNINSGNQQAH
jgi:hypothetical protein